MASIIIPEGLNDILAPTDAGPSSEGSGSALQRRIFIGPMPERLIVQSVESQPKRAKLTAGSVFSLNQENAAHFSDKCEDVTSVLRDNAFKFFLHHGGNADEWKEDDEQDLVDELLSRWKKSEWGQLWEHRHHAQKEPQSAVSNKWIGTSFEVGTLLGVNITQSQQHLNAFSVYPTSSPREIPRLMTLETHNLDSTDEQLVGAKALSTSPADFLRPGSANAGEESNNDFATTSKTMLISSQTQAEDFRNDARPSSDLLNLHGHSDSGAPSGLDSDRLTAKEKGKAKVHYVDTATGSGSIDPEEVLEKTKTAVDLNTSLSATTTFILDNVKSSTPSELSWGCIVLRDRMLVRVDYTKSEGITRFDDNINRSARDLEYEDWGEFLVVWRRDGLELYKDYSVPLQEWAAGHKRLTYVISLTSPRTKLSLYSFVDLTFCITCASTASTLNNSGSRGIFTGSKEGTQIFVFKLRSRSRAYDWYWQLWLHLGGQIPKTIDVYSPRLNTKVTIDIPESGGNQTLYSIFTRENLIQLCLESLRKLPDYKYLIEKALESGKSPQVNWRYQANLDWVWLDHDVFGKPRKWAVLCGVAFKQTTRPLTLEIRLEEHGSNFVHLKDRRKIEEPAAIEGYLDSIKPNTQTKQPVYLVTHSGYLFFINPARPFPPTPPGPRPMDTESEALKHAEIRRGINQIFNATYMMDLRSIVAIRRAFQPVPSQIHTVNEVQDDDRAWFDAWVEREERSSEDDVDQGGDAALAQAYNSTLVKMRRSFELLLNTGRVMRFEAYSCKVAIEWIERLRALSLYWQRRHRMDAQQEIEFAHIQRPRLTPRTRVCHDEHEAASVPSEAVYATLDMFYNWCVLEGCKPIVKSGRIYMRKGLSGQFKLVQLFLIAGHLVTFRIDGQSAIYPSMRKKINLVEGPNAPVAPRRYGDGLETEDREEDMMFMIWYRPHSQILHANQDPTTTFVDGKIPKLSKKLKVVIFKTRSWLERDSWCWAINSEIEKIMRAQVKRETKLSETGNLVPLK